MHRITVRSFLDCLDQYGLNVGLDKTASSDYGYLFYVLSKTAGLKDMLLKKMRQTKGSVLTKRLKSIKAKPKPILQARRESAFKELTQRAREAGSKATEQTKSYLARRKRSLSS